MDHIACGPDAFQMRHDPGVRMQVGTSSSKPSLASVSVPEYYAPSNWRVGSNLSCDIRPALATTSRGCIPLPTSTASASHASFSEACASINKPFIERALITGLAIKFASPAP